MSLIERAGERFSLFLQSLRMRAARPYLKGRVLDIGCDSGRLAFFLPEGSAYTGVDIDPSRIASLKETHPGLEAYCLDIQRETLPAGGRFDTVAALAVIEHLDDPGRFIERCLPLTGPGSTIILTTPTELGERVHRMLRWARVTSPSCSELHHRIYRRGELEALLHSRGFEVFDSRTFELGMNRLVAAVRRGA